MKTINEIAISKQGRKINISVDGEKVDLNDVISMDIHLEYGVLTVQTNKIERMKLGDEQCLHPLN